MEFLGWFEESETLCIAVEYLREGDLTKNTSALPPLPRETAENILRQLREGFGVMHREGITHSDIKPAVLSFPPNALLGMPRCIILTNPRTSSQFPCLPCGSKSRISGNQGGGASKWIQAPDTTTFHTQVSTPSYSAPEVLGLESRFRTV